MYFFIVYSLLRESIEKIIKDKTLELDILINVLAYISISTSNLYKKLELLKV